MEKDKNIIELWARIRAKFKSFAELWRRIRAKL